MDVSSWLRDLGLENYAQAFRANDIDAELLSRLTAEDLIALGVTSIGHRRKLLDAIALLKNGTVPAAAEPIATALRPVEAQRRQLTVLFCDLVGSTALTARLDPEDLRAVMRAYQAVCADVVSRFEGHVAKYLGDGVLAYFGWPVAHEDDAERAVRAGLELADDSTTLAARVGLGTGLIVDADEALGPGNVLHHPASSIRARALATVRLDGRPGGPRTPPAASKTSAHSGSRPAQRRYDNARSNKLGR